MTFHSKIHGMLSMPDTRPVLTEKEAQELLESICELFYLDIAEIMRDGEKVDYMSTEGENLEITVRKKEELNGYIQIQIT